MWEAIDTFDLGIKRENHRSDFPIINATFQYWNIVHNNPNRPVNAHTFAKTNSYSQSLILSTEYSEPVLNSIDGRQT